MTDPMMVSSGYERLPQDSYFTIDPRCVQALARVYPLKGTLFKEPCAGQGHMIKDLEEAGAVLEIASDLHRYEGADPRIQTGIDVFTHPPMGPGTIITNPPFDTAVEMIDHMLHQAPSAWLIVILRATQAHVRPMRKLMGWHRFYALAPLPFRPKWFEGRVSPRHDFSWFLWRPAHFPKHPPRLLL